MCEKTDRISVILPTYNRGQCIARAIESVLSQDYKEIELIVVDDASTDGTREIVSSLGDARVCYVRLPKRAGACAARNEGIRRAKGEYVAFQDSDDVWREGKLSAQMAYLRQTGSDIVFCAFDRHPADGSACERLPAVGTRDGRVAFEELLPCNLVSTQTVLGKRECFLAEPFDERYPRLQDWELALRLAGRYALSFQNLVLVDVYEQPDSISSDAEKGLWAIEHLAAQHADALRRHTLGAIGFASTYAHFARACDRNPWPGFLRMMPKKVCRATLSAIFGQLRQTIRTSASGDTRGEAVR